MSTPKDKIPPIKKKNLLERFTEKRVRRVGKETGENYKKGNETASTRRELMSTDSTSMKDRMKALKDVRKGPYKAPVKKKK